MGLWSDTFGGGNSLQQSIANVTTPGDNTTYVGGVLTNNDTNQAVDDSNAVVGNDGSIFTNNSSSGNDGNGGSNNNVGGAPSGGFLSFLNPVSIIGKLSGWANGLDPENDANTSINGREYYTSSDGMVYTYNALGLPYEVVQGEDGNFVDKLSVVDEETGLTGYQQLAQDLKDSGDDEGAAQVLQEEQQNADNVEIEKTVAEQVLEWAKSTGMNLQNTDIKAIIDDPNKFLADRNMVLEDVVPTLNANAAGTNILGSDPKYSLGEADALNIETATAGDASTIGSVTAATPVSYKASTNLDKMDSSFDVNAATGTIDDDNLVDASTIVTDMQGAATGRNADGTINYSGIASNDYATQKFSSIIDTSTVSGKNLAKALGEGNYLDEKATIAGQMKIISEQFVNAQGQAVIPKWAQKMARSVAQTMAFDGISGSAQTSAMATAIMEATLGIAEREATFFQTLTTKNLDNRQQAIINKANILSRFEVANLGARQAAAVQNAKSFLEMDLKNLTNEQQAEVINKQAKTQALFEDSKIINAQRLFTAEQTNDFNKFYDELNVAVQKHNSSEINAMKKFNAGEINDTREFNAELEDSRARFYANMQYNIDSANAKWRQEVTVKQFQTTWDAISTDVKNSLDLSTEGMNQLWDRTDSLLDFVFRKSEGDANREVTLIGSQLQAQAQQSGGSSWWETILGIGGTLLGTDAGSSAAIKWLKGLSDIRLKKNVRKINTVNGINIYSWEWNDEGIRLGADQDHTTGFIAQDLMKTHPEAISTHDSGYLMVNYKAVQNGLQ